jgi:peptide-methionine (R)-S-oxide reductase
MNRRHFLSLAGKSLAGAAVAAPGLTGAIHALAAKESRVTLEELHENWRSFLPAGYDPVSAADTLTLDADAWRERLEDPLAFDVLRREATERPFTSELNNEKREGVFLCAGCDLPVYTSAMKFDSGTGWPSFFTTIPGAFQTKRDFKLILPRTEYHCARCGGHHGHVFKDGPPPTGQRWCNNGAALKFLPRDVG